MCTGTIDKNNKSRLLIMCKGGLGRYALFHFDCSTRQTGIFNRSVSSFMQDEKWTFVDEEMIVARKKRIEKKQLELKNKFFS